MGDDNQRARLGTEYDRLMADFRGEIPTLCKPSTRPWHRVTSSTPEINSRPVQQVTAPTGKKRDTLEFLTEKQQFINQISKSPLDQIVDGEYGFTQMANAVTKAFVSDRNKSPDSVNNSTPISACFPEIQGEQLSPESADHKILHPRSASVGKLFQKKLLFAFSPTPEKKIQNISFQKLRGRSTRTSSRNSFVTPIPEKSVDKGLRSGEEKLHEKFVITQYSLPARLVAIRKEAGIKLDSGGLRNKEIDLFLSRFQSKKQHQAHPETRTGFSGWKMTVRKPSNSLQKTQKKQFKTIPFRVKSPHATAEAEVYLRYLQFKKRTIAYQDVLSSPKPLHLRAKSSLS